MSISYNPKHHKDFSAFKRHQENLQKDKDWAFDVERYNRACYCAKLCEKYNFSSHLEYWQKRKAELEQKWPQLKRAFS